VSSPDPSRFLGLRGCPLAHANPSEQLWLRWVQLPLFPPIPPSLLHNEFLRIFSTRTLLCLRPRGRFFLQPVSLTSPLVVPPLSSPKFPFVAPSPDMNILPGQNSGGPRQEDRP